MHLTSVKTKVEDMQKAVSEDRQSHIGGSDFGALLGHNPWKSKYRLWCEKAGLISDHIPDNDKMRLGRDMEDYVARRFCEEYGKVVAKSNYRYSIEEYPFIAGHVDRLLRHENAGLECKFIVNNWTLKQELEDGNFPQMYIDQCYAYMAMTGKMRWYLAMLVDGHLYVKMLKRDGKIIESMITEAVAFWQSVQSGIKPSVDESDSTTETLSELYPTASEKAEIVSLSGDWSELKEIDDTIKELEDQKDKIKNRIMEQMQDASEAYADGFRFTWKNVTTTRFNTTKFKKEQPNLYAQYADSKTSRRFTYKTIKEDE